MKCRYCTRKAIGNLCIQFELRVKLDPIPVCKACRSAFYAGMHNRDAFQRWELLTEKKGSAV